MGENELFGNILGEQDIDTLFSAPGETGNEEEETPEKDEGQEDGKKTTTEVVDPEDLFDGEEEEEQPEGVGSGKKAEVKEDASTGNNSGASPNNFYSSIANAMAVDGIFPNLTEDEIKEAADAESFSNLIEAEVNARLDEKQQRVSRALDNGVEPNDIRKYENTLHYINTLTEAQLSEESEKGENLRRGLIYQDFLNKGYSPEKAQKFTERSIDAGTDIEDAKEALQSNKEYFGNAYNTLLRNAENQANAAKAERVKQAEKLRKSLLEDKQLMGDLTIDNNVRKKALEAITKPVYKDPETGEFYTALQKYEAEHHSDFLKYVGLTFTLTNGFKDFESFTKGKVKKEVRKGLRELEHTLNGTSRNTDGSLRMVTGVREDPDSYLGRGIKLDF